MRAKRLFVSLDLPVVVATGLAHLDPHLHGVRWVRAEQIHLTLAFLGSVQSDIEEEFRNQLQMIRFISFFLPLQKFGTFPARGRPKLIWLGVGRGHPHLFQLHKKVADAALAVGLEPDLRPWHPHVTLARCHDVTRQWVDPFLRRHTEFDAGLVPIDAFHLKSSLLTPGGSTYRTELSFGA